MISILREKLVSVATVLMLLLFPIATSAGVAPAGFFDEEKSSENTISTGTLDFSLVSPDDFSGAVSDEQSSKRNVEVKNDGSLGFQYQIRANNFSGDSDLCNNLKLKVGFKGGGELYSESLKDFSYVIGVFSDPEKLEFEAELSDSDTSGLEGEKCNFDLVFEGWQENFANFGDGGFSDVEKISNEVEFEGDETEDLVINEVEYDSVQTDTDSDYEWFEIYNPNDNLLTLKNWTITDNTETDTIPEFTISDKGFVVIAAKKTGFETNYSSFSGDIIYISDGTVGNGLANGGDKLVIKDEKGKVIDAMSYGANADILNPSCADVSAGHSLARSPDGKDTDTASDFINLSSPTPGEKNE